MAEEKTYEVKDEDKIMLILSYFGILCLVPLLSVKPDNEYVRWHAKQGFVLFIAEIILSVVSMISLSIFRYVPFLGILIELIWFIVWLGVLVLAIYAIVQALNGKMWRIPLLADFADKF